MKFDWNCKAAVLLSSGGGDGVEVFHEALQVGHLLGQHVWSVALQDTRGGGGLVTGKERASSGSSSSIRSSCM